MGRPRPEIWWQRTNWLLHHNNAPIHPSFFAKELLAENHMDVIPHLSYLPDLATATFLCNPNWGCHIWTPLRWLRKNHKQRWTPSQLTSRMYFKMAEALGKCMRVAVVASRPKVSFCLDGNISPGNYGYQGFTVFTSLTSVINYMMKVCIKYLNVKNKSAYLASKC
jgi:hypothetical protein